MSFRSLELKFKGRVRRRGRVHAGLSILGALRPVLSDDVLLRSIRQVLSWLLFEWSTDGGKTWRPLDFRIELEGGRLRGRGGRFGPRL